MPVEWPPTSCKLEFYAFHADVKIMPRGNARAAPPDLSLIREPDMDVAPFAFVTFDLAHNTVAIDPIHRSAEHLNKVTNKPAERDAVSAAAEQALVDAVLLGSAPPDGDALYDAYHRGLDVRLHQVMYVWPRYHKFLNKVFPLTSNPNLDELGEFHWHEQWADLRPGTKKTNASQSIGTTI